MGEEQERNHWVEEPSLRHGAEIHDEMKLSRERTIKQIVPLGPGIGAHKATILQ